MTNVINSAFNVGRFVLLSSSKCGFVLALISTDCVNNVRNYVCVFTHLMCVANSAEM